MSELKVKKTKYEPKGYDGWKEPCFEVTDEYGTMVRIVPIYRLVGRGSIAVVQYIDGEYNGEDEYDVDFKSLTKKKALEIARDSCVYLR